jgi:hypothetical protein
LIALDKKYPAANYILPYHRKESSVIEIGEDKIHGIRKENM